MQAVAAQHSTEEMGMDPKLNLSLNSMNGSIAKRATWVA